MHERRTIAIDDPVARRVCHVPAPCKTAERIEVLFGTETSEDLSNIGRFYLSIKLKF